MKLAVSVCLPNLNARPYLEERLQTIFAQTVTDWELIICDSYSDDGSWELFQKYKGDPRIQMWQVPRQGLYAGWNECLRRVRGKFVYIATSDDTMSPDCLEKMVQALECNPDCGMCQCGLQIIDERGMPVDSSDAWENRATPVYLGEWIHIPHVRRAPHDGLLHLGLFCVYTSITQLLIRRQVFDRLGLFRTDCDSLADIEWEMRVGIEEDVVYIPQKLATWRRHDLQATQGERFLPLRAQGEYRRLAQKALDSLSTRDPRLAGRLRKSRLNHFFLANELGARRQLAQSRFAKLRTIAGFVASHPAFSLYWLYCKMIRRRSVTGDLREAVNQECSRLGLNNLLVKLESR
jgi:glycosyltransferase involved in cell wall biosynthesis